MRGIDRKRLSETEKLSDEDRSTQKRECVWQNEMNEKEKGKTKEGKRYRKNQIYYTSRKESKEERIEIKKARK